MRQRIVTTCILVALAGLVVTPSFGQTRYRYGGYRGATSDRGFFAEIEGIYANPRNADAVVATLETIEDFGGGVNFTTPIIPEWSDDPAGRLTVGYQWASGNRLQVSLWGFDTDQESAGNGTAPGFLHFAVGPPIYTGGGYVGAYGSPGYYQMRTEISAQTADLAWAKDHAFGPSFTMEWSAGLRFAHFEETMDGVYDEAASTDIGFGELQYDAAKSNKGDMVGVRVAARGSYRLSDRYFVSAALGFSMLDGELKSSSLLSPTGTVNATTVPAAYAAIDDTSRSGGIVDFDLRAGWAPANDRYRLWVGWEQSEWRGIAEDQMRNLPGTTAPLKPRDSVIFSGYKLGLRVQF